MKKQRQLGILISIALTATACDSGNGIQRTVSGYRPRLSQGDLPFQVYRNPQQYPANLLAAYNQFGHFLASCVTQNGEIDYAAAVANRDNGLQPFLNYLAENDDLKTLSTSRPDAALGLLINAYHAFAIAESLQAFVQSGGALTDSRPFFFTSNSDGKPLPTYAIRGVNNDGQITLAQLATLIQQTAPEALFSLAPGNDTLGAQFEKSPEAVPMLSNVPYGYNPESGLLNDVGSRLGTVKHEFYLRLVEQVTTSGESTIVPSIVHQYHQLLNDKMGPKKLTEATAFNNFAIEEFRRELGDSAFARGLEIRPDARQPKGNTLVLIAPPAAPQSTVPQFVNGVAQIYVTNGRVPKQNHLLLTAARAVSRDQMSRAHASRIVFELLDENHASPEQIAEQFNFMGALLSLSEEKSTQHIAFVQLIGMQGAASFSGLLGGDEFESLLTTPAEADDVCRSWPLIVVADLMQDALVLRSYTCEPRLRSVESTESFARSLR